MRINVIQSSASLGAEVKNFSIIPRCCIPYRNFLILPSNNWLKKVNERNWFLQKQLLFHEKRLGLKYFVECRRKLMHALGYPKNVLGEALLTINQLKITSCTNKMQ